MQIHKYILDFEDENITKTTANGTSKSYIKSQRMIKNNKKNAHIFSHMASSDNIQCSLSTFFRYNPFYIILHY